MNKTFGCLHDFRGNHDIAQVSLPHCKNKQGSVVCSDNLRYMKCLPDAMFKLIITSPPYNLGKSYEDRAGLDEYLAMQERVIGECVRLLPEKTVHPCQFPVELVERLVLSMTDEGDYVFDPYMGVGSAVVAAIMHNRYGYGCDLIQEYVDIAQSRLDALAVGTLRTRPMGKPIYDPTLPNGGH